MQIECRDGKILKTFKLSNFTVCQLPVDTVISQLKDVWYTSNDPVVREAAYLLMKSHIF